MKFIDFKIRFKAFEIIDIQNVLNVFSTFDRRRLFEWQKKGYIRKITSNFYVFGDAKIDDVSLRVIANTIYKPSYIGLESAMALYGLIPEAVYQLTSVTSKNTKKFETCLAQFTYRSIRKSLFWGYRLHQGGRVPYYISDPEKTIVDYFYLNPRQSDVNAIVELRLNKQRCRELIDRNVLQKYARCVNSGSVVSAVHILQERGYVKS